MNRVEIEIELHRGRADQLEWITSFSDEDLTKDRTQSEDNPDSWWNAADHFVHTTLIEKNFNAMVRRHINGEQGMDPNMVDANGERFKKLEDVMAYVHRFTEGWKVEQHGKPLDELVKIGLSVRADTLQLLSELTDEQLASKIPGAPWGDGTVGGVLAVHAAHYRMHRHWTEEAEGHNH